MPKPRLPRPALVLTVVAILSGLALGGVNFLTKDAIEAQQLAANAAAYQAVLPAAERFSLSDSAESFVKEYGKQVYGTGSYGRVYIGEGVEGYDAAGNLTGYAVSVTTADGFDGNIVLTVGVASDGTVNGISFTELNETAGMGMRVDEESWKAQFAGVKTTSF
ncbi:MAG: FMN-binding protein, partial [bacterium]